MSSSPEAIQAYLAHLKKTTSAINAASPDENLIDHFLENDANLSDFSSSPAKASKKPVKTYFKGSKLSENLRKYEKKYVRGDVKKIIHKSSVERVPEESDEDSVADGSTSDKSILDSQLEQWLQETSLSDASPKSATVSRARKSGLKNVLSAESLFQSSPAHRSVSRENLFSASNRRRAFGASRGGSGDPPSQSLSYELSDVRSGVREGDQTISTTPERSIGSLLRKTSKNSIFKSSSLRDDSSTPEEYLSRKISRRDSYVYKDGVGLVSASSSSNETIHTDFDISDEIDERSSEVHTQSVPEVESKSDEILSGNSPVTSTSEEKRDPQANFAQASSNPGCNRTKTKKKIPDTRRNSLDNNVSPLDCSNYSSTFESNSSRDTPSRSGTKNGTKLNSTAGTESNHDNHTLGSSVLESKSTSNSRTNHMTSSTSISLENTSASEISSHYTHKNYKRSKKHHKHRSYSHESRCSRCDRSIRHARRKKKHRRREPYSSDYSSSSSSSDSSVTVRKRARSCRKCRRRKRNECKNCKHLQDLLLWSTSRERLWSFDVQNLLPVVPVGLGTSKSEGALAKVERVEDAMRETISLGHKFLACQRSLYGAYCSTLQSTHRYTTLRQLREASAPASQI